MRILVGPVLVGDRICRIVSPIESLLEVEEWVGEWWEPSQVTLTLASQSPTATAAELAARGVPGEDCAPDAPRATEATVQRLLLASPSSAAETPGIDGQPHTRAHGKRRKVYPGNARFRQLRMGRRAGRATAVADERRSETPVAWTGPWRRATDHAAPAAPDLAVEIPVRDAIGTRRSTES